MSIRWWTRREWERLDGALKWPVVTAGGNDLDNTERVWMELWWK